MNIRPSHILLAFVALGLIFLMLALAQPLAAANAPAAPAAQVSAPNWGGCQYWVRRGDSLFGIAVRYGVSWWYLAQTNGLYNPNLIYAGMMLVVPCDGQPQYPPHKPPYPPPPPRDCGKSIKYLVKPGDNLFRIALNYGTTVNALRDANNLWGRVLRAGMTLIIPCPTTVPEATTMPPADRVPKALGTPPAQDGQATTVPPPGVVTEESVPQGTPVPTAGANTLPPEPSASVNLQNGKLDPAAVTVKAGQSVLWINSDQIAVTLVSGSDGKTNNLFSSPQLPPGGTFIYTFTTGGNYPYFVLENPSIQGQINVTP